MAIVSQSSLVTNGATVRELRDRAGYTVRGFAALLGVHYTHLSKVELGDRQPGVKLRNRIADALSVPIEAIAAPEAARQD